MCQRRRPRELIGAATTMLFGDELSIVPWTADRPSGLLVDQVQIVATTAMFARLLLRCSMSRPRGISSPRWASANPRCRPPRDRRPRRTGPAQIDGMVEVAPPIGVRREGVQRPATSSRTNRMAEHHQPEPGRRVVHGDAMPGIDVALQRGQLRHERSDRE